MTSSRFALMSIPTVCLFLGSLSAQSQSPTEFIRGDCNGDGYVNIADLAYNSRYLFQDGEIPACLNACDNNDDAKIDVADLAHHFNSLFSGGGSFLPPYPRCGVDPTPTMFPTCLEYALSAPLRSVRIVLAPSCPVTSTRIRVASNSSTRRTAS